MNVYVWTDILKNAYIGEVWTPWANTIAYYPLETNANDYSWNNRNLTNSWITFSDNVWVFNWSAVGKYADNSLWNSLTRFTYSIYVYTTSIPSGMSGGVYNRCRFMFIYQWNSSTFDKALYLYDSSKIGGYNYDENNSTEKIVNATWISTNTWYHIAYTFDGTNIKIYKNWVLVDTKACDSCYTWYTSATLWIGWNETNNGWMKTFNGKLSKVIIENKVRTAEEVSWPGGWAGGQTDPFRRFHELRS